MSVYGCTIEPMDPGRCALLVAWARGGERPSWLGSDLRWLLARTDAGIVWGRCEGDRWVLPPETFQDCCGSLRKDDSIQELRLSGPEAEALVWHAGAGFAGRLAADGAPPLPPPPWTPADETRLLLGDRVARAAAGDFTLVANGAGRRQVVPFTLSDSDFPPAKSEPGEEHRRQPALRLRLRHYFAQEEETGAARVGLSRLVGVDMNVE